MRRVGRGSSLQLAYKQTEQFGNGDESLAICVNFTSSEIKSYLPTMAATESIRNICYLALADLGHIFDKQVL